MSNDQPPPQGDPHHSPYAHDPQAPAPAPGPPPPGPYGPGPYGSGPVPPSAHAPAPRRSGAALASLIIGIIALLLCLIPLINIVSVLGGIAAVVLGIVGIRKVVPGVVGGKGMAIAGIITGTIGTIVAALVLVFTGLALNAIGSEEFQRFVDEAIEEAEAQSPTPVAPEAPGDDAATGDEPVDVAELSCADLADEAIRIAQENPELLALDDVVELAIDEDNRPDYDIPSGSDESLVMSCTGTAYWEDGSIDPVVLALTVDSTGEVFVSYDLQ